MLGGASQVLRRASLGGGGHGKRRRGAGRRRLLPEMDRLPPVLRRSPGAASERLAAGAKYVYDATQP